MVEEAVIIPANADVLPDSRLRQSKGVILGAEGFFRMNWVPIFCANCGVPGGMVPEENCNFAFYLCDARKNDCVSKWTNLVDTMLVPDEVFWANVRAEQIERYGRELSPPEMVEALKNDEHPLTKMAKDRNDYNPFYRQKVKGTE